MDENENKFVDENGVVRHLGNIMPPDGLVKAWPVFGTVPETPLVPRDQWNDLVPDEADEFDAFIQYVHDQDGIGMCNASATVSAMERRRAIAGLPFVSLSGGDLYGRINGGRDQGSLLEDGLAKAMSEGVASAGTVPYLDWRKSYSGANEERKTYRVEEAFLCPTFVHCYSAVIAGFDLITGIMWGNNFKTDSGGWLPSKLVGRGGGHAIHGFKPTRRKNTYGIWHKNSWTTGWGYHGFMVIPESLYGGPVGGWWAVRSVRDEGGVVPRPKK